MSTSYNLSSIAEIIDGKLAGKSSEVITTLLIDSRKIILPEGVLFFAIEGEQHNGHKYITQLVERGFKNFIVREEQDLPNNCSQIIVQNTQQAFQNLAKHHREKFSYPVLAITGSNGKTIVKEWLFQLLQIDKNVVRSPKSYNSQVGVPLSIWKMNESHELAIIEAGISRSGEMEKLQQVIQPTDVLITNLHEAHDENFESRQQKANEKTKLVENAQRVFYCKDYKEIDLALTSFSGDKLCWSRHDRSAELFIESTQKNSKGTQVQAIYKEKKIDLLIPFQDSASVENGIHCWLYLLENGYANSVIQERISHLSSVSMRLELKAGSNNNTLINDTYNSDVASLGIALDLLNQQHQHRNKILILSDILESGLHLESLYKEVAKLIDSKGVKNVIGVGEDLFSHQELFEKLDCKFYESTAELLNELPSLNIKNSSVLIKGARKFKFEKISQALEQKTHETVLEINLSAIQNNLNYYRTKLKRDTKLMVMVKAFSYGSGSYEIANLLQFNNVDYLGVAYTDEGIELRKAGITLPIMVMNPEKDSFSAMIKYSLEPEIYSIELLQNFTEKLQSSLASEGESYPIHIKLDTGMHRLGFEEQDMSELLSELKTNKWIRVQSVFSHLAGSGNEAFDDFTKTQADLFEKAAADIENMVGYQFDRHILNSGGIERFPEYQYNLVRLGIGLHGLGTTPEAQKKLQTAAILKSTISQIRKVKKGQTVGYNRSGIAERDIEIATVSIGYADGYSRRLGNGVGQMELNGKLVSIVGDVCMDMCMLDVTDVKCSVGDSVIVFGSDKIPLTAIASQMGTIPYEVLTGISQRVKRVYFQE